MPPHLDRHGDAACLRPLRQDQPVTDSDYQCQVCGEWYVVRVLARDCETKHAQEQR
jgi:hypothetical protein